MKRKIYKKIFYVCIMFSLQITTKNNIPTLIPESVMLTNVVNATFDGSITDIFIDCYVNDTDPFFTRTLSSPNRRFVATGAPPYNFGYVQSATDLPQIKDAQADIKKLNWDEGVYIHAFIVDTETNLVRNPRNLSNNLQGNPYIAFYDKDFNLKVKPFMMSGPWGGNGAGYFGNIPINYQVQTWRIVINNSISFNIPYGAPLFLKKGKDISIASETSYDSSLCKTPKVNCPPAKKCPVCPPQQPQNKITSSPNSAGKNSTRKITTTPSFDF